MNNQTNWQNAGFLNDEDNADIAMGKLAEHIEQMPVFFKKFSGEELLNKLAPDKWSKQEILGHLIDSALNNLKRFTEIQFLPQPYIVVSYRQNELVDVNNYQSLPLDHLLNLWTSLNQQIIHVVKNTSKEKLNYAVNPQYDNKEMKSLSWIICDYVAHMEHHLKQLQ